MPSKRKRPSSSSPSSICQAAIDPLTPSEALAEREFSLNPDYLKVKLLMLTTEFLVATRDSDTDVLLGVSTIDYLARGFDLIGLKSVAAVLAKEDAFVSDYESALSQALFSLSADRSLDKYKLPDLPSAPFPHEDTRFDFSPPAKASAVTMHVQIEGSSPAIWRRITVPSRCSLGDLHDVIQTAFGWNDEHLYEFKIKKKVFSCTDEFADSEHVDYNSLEDFRFRKGSKFEYTYDLGDHWLHSITVEEIKASTEEVWEVLGGERKCPPEDCGGIDRYQDLLEACTDEDHPLREDAMYWLGNNFDAAEKVHPRSLEGADSADSGLSADDTQIVIISSAESPIAFSSGV